MAMMTPPNRLPNETRIGNAAYDEQAVQKVLSNPNVGNPFPAGSPEWIAVAEARSGRSSQGEGPTGDYAPNLGPGSLAFDGSRESISNFFKSRGVPDTETDYWVSKWPELVARGKEIGDPNYAMMRLNNAEILGGHYGSPAPGGGGFGGGTMGSLGGVDYGDPANIMRQDPGYQFRLGEGLGSIESGAAARGTLLTGGTQRALQRYAQDYASGEFGNIFNRNLSLAQLGENAAAGVGNFGANYAANAGNLLTGAGNAQAAGTVGSANAWNGTLGNIGNDALLYYLLNQSRGGATA